MPERLRIRKNIFTLSGILALAILGCFMLVTVRIIITGRFAQGYLLWNLLLAVIPYVIAIAGLWFSGRLREGFLRKFGVALAFIAWLLFYPNAPYIFTDFVHVINRSNLRIEGNEWLTGYDLLWYDIVMYSAFAFIGHYIGLVSMYIVHGLARKYFGKIASWLLISPAMMLSGFGIYLGRFTRLNSWDVFINPGTAFPVIAEALVDKKAMLFAFGFSCFIGLTYLMFFIAKEVPFGFPKETSSETEPPAGNTGKYILH